MIEQVERMFAGKHAPLRPVLVKLYELLISLGCEPRVKTIYVGFMYRGETVASAHPRKGREIEVALALPDEGASGLLYDASHLKWRTLPVAVRLTDVSSFEEAKPLIQEAVRRVREGVHDVKVDNTRFAQVQKPFARKAGRDPASQQ